MDIKKVKDRWNATILDILKAFMQICDKHGLRYYCCAGTAIGAVRHHGIIPWDDDIDVIMPRPDYDQARNVQVYTGSYGYKEVFPKEWLGDGKMFPFEDTEVPLPQEYDKYLRHFFGDYMQLPPVEQRVEKHHRAYVNLDRKETREEAVGKLRIKN